MDDARPTRWVLKPQEDGTVHVYAGTKMVGVAHDDMKQATRYVQGRIRVGDTVKVEDPDGYLRTVRTRRKHWREGILYG